MEILHKGAKRTVLAALDDSETGTQFCDHLSSDFKVVRVNSADDCLKIMRERVADLSAVIVDIEMAMANDFDTTSSVVPWAVMTSVISAMYLGSSNSRYTWAKVMARTRAVSIHSVLP